MEDKIQHFLFYIKMEDSDCRNVSKRLRTEFDLKRKTLLRLQSDVNSYLDTGKIQNLFLVQLQSKSENKKNNVRNENIDEIMWLRHKLDGVSHRLREIHTEGSQEHIHLNSVHKQLIRIHKTRETTTLNTSTDFQNLARLVKDLQSEHQYNCQLKEEIENRVNEAYRKIAKKQAVLGRQCSESSNPLDKENADRLLDDFVMQHINPQKLSLQDRNSIHPQKVCLLEHQHSVSSQNQTLKEQQQSCLTKNVPNKKLPLRDKN